MKDDIKKGEFIPSRWHDIGETWGWMIMAMLESVGTSQVGIKGGKMNGRVHYLNDQLYADM